MACELDAGAVRGWLADVRATYPDLAVQVEADPYEQALAAVAAGADLLLLDNMTTEEMSRTVAAIGERATLEASGGLTLERAPLVAATGVDYVAVGALTRAPPALDLGLDLRTAEVGG